MANPRDLHSAASALERKVHELIKRGKEDVPGLLQDAEFQDTRLRLIEKCFYSVIEAARQQMRKQDSGLLRSLLSLHLHEAHGFYWHLLQQLGSQAKGRKEEPARARALLHTRYRCLVFLGDIARYQEMKETARQWYSQAAQMFPKDGGAFNQLGVCASEPLEALYFYSRALCADEPSPRAWANLEAILRAPQRIKSAAPIVSAVVRRLSAVVTAKGTDHTDDLEPLARDFVASVSDSQGFAVLLQLTVLMVAVANKYPQANLDTVALDWARWVLEGAVPMLERGGHGDGLDLALGAGLIVGEWQTGRSRGQGIQLLPRLAESWRAKIKDATRIAREAWLAPITQVKCIRLPGICHFFKGEFEKRKGRRTSLYGEPLTHDYRLVGFAPLSASQQLWAWSTSHACCSLPTEQQLVIMLARLSALDPATPVTQEQGVHRRDQVMRAMGRQRLLNQVSSLETTAEQSYRGHKFSLVLYVVPDLECLVSNLRLVKELVGMARYIVVVSRGVIAALDELKKGSTRRHQGARDATRYLEDRFAKGDQWLQLQDDGPTGGDLDGDLLSCCAAVTRSGVAGPVALLTERTDGFEEKAADAETAVVVARIAAFVNYARRQSHSGR